jgi:hypothetical protein
MPLVHIVALKNDDISNNNMDVAFDKELWGIQTKGKHESIKKGDLVLFLLGISINNKDELSTEPLYSQSRFPNFKNDVLSDYEFISKFVFDVDKVYFGKVTSDFFQDPTPVWPGRIKKNGTVEYYQNRFRWSLESEGQNFRCSSTEVSTDFQIDIIRALRDKGAQPSELDESTISAIKRCLQPVIPKSDEDNYQEKLQNIDTKNITIPSGAIAKDLSKRKPSTSEQWNRDPKMAAIAIENANYQCEINPDHKTFISDKSGKNFLEAHHFIPMKYQEYFDVSIDVPENILALCPNCHRAFHHAQYVEKGILIDTFFLKRVNQLISRGIDLKIDSIKDYYG